MVTSRRFLAGFVLVTALASGRVPVAGQRYALPTPTLAPVEMHASCASAAAAEVNQGVAWLLVLDAREARRAFVRAADADPDCALAYWGHAASYLPIDEMAPAPDAMKAGAGALTRARSLRIAASHERALVESLAPVFLPDPLPNGAIRALPARLRLYRDQVCAIQDDAARTALRVLCARAAWLGSTLPHDAAAIDATRIIAETFDEDTLTVGAAVALLQADAAPSRLLLSAAGVILRASPPLAAPLYFACRAFARAGDWSRAAQAGEAALGRAGWSAWPVSECLLDVYVEQGRRGAARSLLASADPSIDPGHTGAEPPDPEAMAAHRDSLARAWVRWTIAELPLAPDARSPAMPPPRPTPDWLAAFSRGLAAAYDAWPGGMTARVAEAKTAMSLLAREHAERRDPEVELARVLIEATIAASQDEHQQMSLMLTHAVDLEARLQQTRRRAWPLAPGRTLAAWLWQRAYLDANAEREARAALDERPNRVQPWLVLARAAARLKRAEDAAFAYTRILEIRRGADDGDAFTAEARAFLAAANPQRPGDRP